MRELIFKAHMYIGLCVGLLLSVMGLTGSMLVFGEEIDRWLNPALLRVEPRTEKASLEKLLASVRDAYPNEKVARLRLPRSAEDACEVCFEAKADALCVYVDPYNSALVGSRVPARSFKARLLSLHRRLLSGETGETIIGVAGIFLLLLSFSGVVLWWPGRRQLARAFTIRWRGSRYRVAYDLHRALGICAMLFLSFTALTGAAMVFRPTVEKVLGQLAPAPPAPPRPASTLREGERPSLDEILRRADTALPEGETTIVTLPATPTATFVVRKHIPGDLHPSGRSLVYLDQYTGQILQTENALEAPARTRIINNLYPLHVGRLGGVFTRTLQVFVGCVPAILFLTGLTMWRTRARARKRANGKQPLSSSNETNEAVG